MSDDVRRVLERHRVALCVHDMKGASTGRERLGPFGYVRFHGSSGHYSGAYSDDRLAGWADWLAGERARGADTCADRRGVPLRRSRAKNRSAGEARRADQLPGGRGGRPRGDDRQPTLPGPSGTAGDRHRKGHDSESKWAPSLATALTDRAALKNNEEGS